MVEIGALPDGEVGMTSYRWLAGALAACAVMLNGAVANAQDIKLKYSAYLPESFTAVQIDKWFMEEVTKRTNGRVTFETYFGGSLLSAVETVPGLTAGVADFGSLVPIYNPELLPLAGIIQPFLSDKVDAVARAYLDLSHVNAAFGDEWKRNKLKMLYPMVTTEDTMWSHKQVSSADDLKGMRIRAATGNAEALGILGATPVAMPFADGVEAYKNGAIDGFSTFSFDVAENVGLIEMSEYVSNAGRMGTLAPAVTAFNLDSWERLPKDVQDVILEVADLSIQRYLGVIDKTVDATVDALLKNGKIVVTRISDEEAARWKDAAAQAVWDKWIARVEGMGVADARGTFNQFRELIAKYEPTSTYVTGLDRYWARKPQ